MANSKPNRLLHIGRVICCFATFGFVFPGALMENIEAERAIAKENARRAPDIGDPPRPL